MSKLLVSSRYETHEPTIEEMSGSLSDVLSPDAALSCPHSNEQCQMKESHLAAKDCFAFVGSCYQSQESMQDCKKRSLLCHAENGTDLSTLDRLVCRLCSPDSLNAIQETQCAAQSRGAG